MFQKKNGFESLKFRMNHPSTGAQRNERVSFTRNSAMQTQTKLIVNFSLNRNYKSVHSVSRNCEMTLRERRPSGEGAIVPVLSTHYTKTINYID